MGKGAQHRAFGLATLQAVNGLRVYAGLDPKETRALGAGCCECRCCPSVCAQVSMSLLLFWCAGCFHPAPSLADSSHEPVQWKVPLVMAFCHFDPCLTAAAAGMWMFLNSRP